MSINLSKKKIVIVLALMLVAGGFTWWFNFSKVSRKQKSEYKQLVRFANRQEVEIAIIKQVTELQRLRLGIIKSQPVIADPASTEVSDGK